MCQSDSANLIATIIPQQIIHPAQLIPGVASHVSCLLIDDIPLAQLNYPPGDPNQSADYLVQPSPKTQPFYSLQSATHFTDCHYGPSPIPNPDNTIMLPKTSIWSIPTCCPYISAAIVANPFSITHFAGKHDFRPPLHIHITWCNDHSALISVCMSC